jgi:hypothetical protein
LANEAAIIPFPNEDVTPPVTKMNLAIVIFFICFNKIKFQYVSIEKVTETEFGNDQRMIKLS